MVKKKEEPRYFFDRDESGHWYLVDADKREEWETWLVSEEAMNGEESEHASMLPFSIKYMTFTDPRDD